LLPDLYGEFYAELIRGIDQTAQRHGYHLLVASSHNDTATIQAALQAMRGRVDGLIVMAPAPGAHGPVRVLPQQFPVVLLNCNASARAFDSIVPANRQGAYQMVRYLARLGHRRIAIIAGPQGNFDAAERLRGYHAALELSRIRAARQLEIAADFTQGSGFEACQTLLAREPRPTAIFAANDAMAIGALAALFEAGLRVPVDVSVAGFDDIPMARYVQPPLTTVRVDIRGVGERATTRLLEAVGNGGRTHHNRREVLPVKLVIRESCSRLVPR
jgi:LacI family transcriptional regulator